MRPKFRTGPLLPLRAGGYSGRAPLQQRELVQEGAPQPKRDPTLNSAPEVVRDPKMASGPREITDPKVKRAPLAAKRPGAVERAV